MLKKRDVLLGFMAVAVGVAQAVLIDFENNDWGVAASDNKVITTQYKSGAGVSFFTGAHGNTDYANFNGSAYLEQMGAQAGEVGNTGSGFAHKTDVSGIEAIDTVATGTGMDGLTQAGRATEMGNYFLRTASYSTDSMVVIYDTAVTAASFEIWDIDGNDKGSEQWRITAYSGADWATQVLQLSTFEGVNNADATSYDGQCLVVSLQAGQDQTFDRFVIEFIGSKPTNAAVGLAFNNFDTEAVPEPTSMALLVFGVAALALRRKSS